MRKPTNTIRVDIERYLNSDEFKVVPPPVVTDGSFIKQPSDPNKSRLSGSHIIDSVLGKPYRRFTHKRVRHQMLDQHLSIAWDLDSTLIDGPQSWFWRRWIRDNYKNHKFWIMTFRTPEAANRIWSDLRECSDPLNPDWFEGIKVVEPVLWDAWARLPDGFEDLDHESKITPALESTIKTQKLDLQLIISINRAIRAWKATECKKVRCSILVEDREMFCKPYCDALGIQFLNALTG